MADFTSTRRQPPPGEPFDDVGADQYPFVLEGGLEERRRRSRLDDAARLRKRLPDMPVIVGDGMAAGIKPARRLADLMPGIEYRLQDNVGLGPEIGPMGLVPEPQVALRPGHVARLGEPGPVHRSVRSFTLFAWPKPGAAEARNTLPYALYILFMM